MKRKLLCIALALALCAAIAAPAAAYEVEPKIIPSITIYLESADCNATLTDVYDRYNQDWYSLMYGGDYADAFRHFFFAPEGTITFDKDVTVSYHASSEPNPLRADGSTKVIKAGETVKLTDFPKTIYDDRSVTNYLTQDWSLVPLVTAYEFWIWNDNAFTECFFMSPAPDNYPYDFGLDGVYYESDERWTEYWGWYTRNLMVDQPVAPPVVREQPSDWAATFVETAIAENLLPETLQSKYGQATTRAEFCALAVALYERVAGEITGRAYFDDTEDVNVQKAAAVGIVLGTNTELGLFSPDDNLTREQAAVMLSRLSKALGVPLLFEAATFSDMSGVSTWAVEAVGQMQANGIMTGYTDGTFAPHDPYTREQSIITIVRLYDIVK